MAEHTLRLEISVGRRSLRAFLAFAMMLCAAPELGSESLTLSTYYPAPSGVYTQMITTGNTYLARDTATNGGRVGIGTVAPAYLLHVNGTLGAGQTYLTNSDIYFTQTAHNHTGIGNTAGYAAIENAANYNTLMILGRAGGIGGGRSVSIWDRLDINGNTYANGDLYSTNRVDVTGGTGSLVVRNTNCGAPPFTSYTAGVVSCPGGYYATLISGVYVKYQIINAGPEPAGEMLCCLCPPGGCPPL